MENKGEILTRNQHINVGPMTLYPEMVKRDGALISMDQWAQIVAVAFMEWGRNKEPHLTESELFELFKNESTLFTS